MLACGRGSARSAEASTANTSSTAYASSKRVSLRFGAPRGLPHAARSVAPGARAWAVDVAWGERVRAAEVGRVPSFDPQPKVNPAATAKASALGRTRVVTR